MENEEKLKVLAKIAHALNKAEIAWAVGGSMLLYFKGITTEFHDIDLMIVDEDVDAVKAILRRMGTLEPSQSKPQYRTKVFFEFVIDGVEVDVLAGFVIVKDGMEYDCSLKVNDIVDDITLENERIPLHSLAAWRRNYELMGKPEKVRMIDAATEKG